MRHYYLYTCEIYLVVRHILSGYMYVENGEKSIKGLAQMQGRQTGGGWHSTPPDFEKIFF